MKKPYKNQFDKKRRDLLKLMAGAGVTQGLLRASPLVAGMMLSRQADAQTSGPSRVVCVYTPDGAIPERWHPNSNLTSFGAMSEPYQAVREQCNFLSGMTVQSGGHGMMPLLLNNGWGGDSFDVQMGKTIGADNPFKYLSLGVHGNGQGIITRDSGAEVTFQDNPFNAFSTVFGNGGGNGGGGGGGNSKGSVIDAHKDALSALQTKLGNYERQRLDQHLTSIEEIEARLNATANPNPGSCSAPGTPSQFPLEYATFDEQVELQIDIIVAALQCNLTSSVTLALGNHQGEFTLPGLNWTDIYHGSIHGGNADTYTETRRKLSTYSVRLIERLRDAGLIDSTLVINITDMGHGNAHGVSNAPFVISGGGSAVRRGVATNTGGNQYDLIHTAAVLLGADEHPAYTPYSSNVLSGIMA